VQGLAAHRAVISSYAGNRRPLALVGIGNVARLFEQLGLRTNWALHTHNSLKEAIWLFFKFTRVLIRLAEHSLLFLQTFFKSILTRLTRFDSNEPALTC
jgi:hypothetical protein